MKELIELGDLERAVHLIFEEKVPFNHLLGVKVDGIAEESVRMRIDMRDEFVGHFVHRVLHGGVTASVLDVTGGLAAFV
jgi:acyl-coenzyme A thioesterase PaaI-like protein